MPLLSSRHDLRHFVKIMKMSCTVRSRLEVAFPPERGINFEINKMPHEKIPSKMVYRMSPIEQQELWKQLDELIGCDSYGQVTRRMDPLFSSRRRMGG
jgi:hypothetical protein